MSQIFNCIIQKYNNKQLSEPFKVSDFKDCLGKSKAFLAKHSLDSNQKSKKVYGNPYFERVGRGNYRINLKYKPAHNKELR